MLWPRTKTFSAVAWVRTVWMILLPDLLHLRRAGEQLPEWDALHLEELLGLERLRLLHAGQRVGDAHPDDGHLVLRGEQLTELSPRLCGRRIDGGAQRGDALQDRSGGTIFAGLGLGERPDLIHALELLAVLVDGADGRLEPLVPRGEGIVRLLQRRADIGEVPLRGRWPLSGQWIDARHHRGEPLLDLLDQLAVREGLGQRLEGAVGLLGAAEDLREHNRRGPGIAHLRHRGGRGSRRRIL